MRIFETKEMIKRQISQTGNGILNGFYDGRMCMIDLHMHSRYWDYYSQENLVMQKLTIRQWKKLLTLSTVIMVLP